MDVITWKDEYNVGIHLIDYQHINIVCILNNLLRYRQRDNAAETLSNIITSMVHYTIHHFKDEEKFMLEIQYDDYEAHKKNHIDFLKKALELNQATAKDLDDRSLHILGYLKKWWINHILNVDMKLKPFIDSVLS